MSWIDVIPPEEAEGALAEAYRRFSVTKDADNIIQVHSLRPHTLEGHMALYKNVLHHPRNSLSKAFAECIGVFVSIINGCEYCIAHHSRAVHRLDPEHSKEILCALRSGTLDKAFSPRERAALEYAAILTESPNQVRVEAIDRLRGFGWPDGEILEINQIVSYFAYANRTILGLGVQVENG